MWIATLSELDTLYNTTIGKLPVTDRLSYCSQQLDKLQGILQKNVHILDTQQKKKLGELIEALQGEVAKLEKQ